MSLYLYIFGSVFLVSVASLIGIFFLFFSESKTERIIMFLVSLSAGTMLGDAAIHLLPEAAEKADGSLLIWYLFLAGVLMFFVLEKIVHWHHCHNHEECEHSKTLGVMNLVGDALHNFIDGAVIAGAFLVSIPLGVATLIAVLAHEVPQEIGDLGVLIHSGYTRTKALTYNFLSALLSVIGAAATLLLSTKILNLTDYILPVTAGGFIYIATADLIPELKKHTALSKTLQQFLGIILGIVIMALLKKLG